VTAVERIRIRIWLNKEAIWFFLPRFHLLLYREFLFPLSIHVRAHTHTRTHIVCVFEYIYIYIYIELKNELEENFIMVSDFIVVRLTCGWRYAT